jgi:hypothetical protein
MKFGQTFSLVLGVIGFLLIAHLFVRWLSPILGVSPGWVVLGLLVITSAGMSAALSHWRRKQEESDLQQLAAEENISEGKLEEIRRARRSRYSKAKTAVRVGIVWVNGPILPIMLGPLAFTQYILNIKSNVVSALAFLGGFLAAWAWWSVNVSLWRRWAARRQVDAQELQSQAEEASLVWPKGDFFERTELDNVFKRRNAQQIAQGTTHRKGRAL